MKVHVPKYGVYSGGQAVAKGRVAPVRRIDSGGRGDQLRPKRGPYRVSAVPSTAGNGRPSRVLAQNIRSYRLLRSMTQDQLAVRMTGLGHGWGRSMVSAIEGNGRNVTIDELFGLAITFGVTVGRLLDPSGPDGSRNLSLDVGLGPLGDSNPLWTHVGRLFAASRAVIRAFDTDSGTIELEMASDAPTASPPEPDEMGTGFGSRVRERLKTTSGS